MPTQLESLANEILLDLFELIPPLDLFRVFYSLNTRLNILILFHSQNYRIDFRSISNEDFNIICRDYLPLIINRIIYFRFSDDDDTPRQSIDFLSYNFKLSQSKFLRSLTFHCMHFDSKMNELFFQEIDNLHNLTHLKFVNCRFEFGDNKNYLQLINQIWSLPKLIYCYWDGRFYGGEIFYIPTVVSLSLKHLYIHHITWEFNRLVRLLDKTPSLEYFSTTANFTYTSDDHADDTPPSSMNLSMQKLKLHGISSPRVMINTLYRMPNLLCLNIDSSFILLDGHQWKAIIIKYLPKLKTFRLNMSYEFDKPMKKETYIDELLDTYRTSFWIKEHDWFTGCLWDHSDVKQTIYLYSLPFSIQYYSGGISQGNCRTKSTDLSNINYSYDHVRCLTYCSSIFTNTEFSNVELNHVEYLGLTLPFDDRFLSIFTCFDNLLSLGLKILNDYPFQLQSLLDKAPRLFQLEFLMWSTKEMSPYNLTSKSIRRLNLEGCDEFNNHHCFDHQQCIKLTESPLGIQCQVLHIEVGNPMSIFELVDKMINLRTLHVRYQYDSQSQQPDLLQLLKRYLPSTSSVTRTCYGQFLIRL